MTRLEEVRAWCASSQPIFIVGQARSGTSMLQVAFAQHPRMFNIRNARETFIFLRPQQPLTNPVHFPTKAYLDGRANLMGYRKWVDETQRQVGGELSDADLVGSFFWYAGTHVYPGRQPLEKTPGHLRKLPLMFDVFPQAKVIVCSRDPVDVVASYRKRYLKSTAEGVDPSRTAWLNKTPEEMVKIFQSFTTLYRNAKPRYGSQMYMAPYEWLVGNPEQALRDICEFVEMPFVPEMVSAPPSANAQGGQSEDFLDDDDESESSKSHGIQKRESDAHQVLTPDAIAYVQAETKAWLDEWNTPGVLG